MSDPDSSDVIDAYEFTIKKLVKAINAIVENWESNYLASAVNYARNAALEAQYVLNGDDE